VRARRSRDRRTCDSVRGQSTTPWPPCVPEAAPAVPAGPGAMAVEVGAAAAIVAEDDLHHHGNWTRYTDNTLVNTPPSCRDRSRRCTVDDERQTAQVQGKFKDRHVWTDTGSVAPTVIRG